MIVIQSLTIHVKNLATAVYVTMHGLRTIFFADDYDHFIVVLMSISLISMHNHDYVNI